jgi:lipid-A-disaccharide synthase-like uncharacterized protein
MRTLRACALATVTLLAAAAILAALLAPASAAEAPDAHATEATSVSEDPETKRLVFRKHTADAFDAGVPWYWLAFGFLAQAMFTGRFMVQWIASERAKQSVVPVSFWILSLLGSLGLLAYFIRRGDPVAIAGQLPNSFIYIRNLMLIRRAARATAASS